MVVVLALIFVWRVTTQELVPSPVPSTLTGPVPTQPGVGGYLYQVTEERYVVRGQSGELETQERRRESWRAADGWTWARQTGYDPAKFIFAPDPNVEAIKRTAPTVGDVEKAMDKILAAVPQNEMVKAKFNFVSDLIGSESLPAEALPRSYRKALVGVLYSSAGVDVAEGVLDPLGRRAIRIQLTGAASTISIYLDQGYQYLAYVGTAPDSAETASRVVTERRQVAMVPDDLLAKLGSERVVKAEWE